MSADTTKTSTLNRVRALGDKPAQYKRDVTNKVNTAVETTHSFADAIQVRARQDLMIKRTAHQWGPWAISGAVATIALANTLAAHLSGDALTSGAYTLGGAVMVLGLGVAAIRKRTSWASKLTPRTPNQRRWVLLCVGAALSWLTVAVVAGISINADSVGLWLALVLSTVALSRAHWARHRIADPAPESTAPLAPSPDLLQITESDEEEEDYVLPEDVQVYIDRWAEAMGSSGVMRDSHLEFDDYIYGSEDDNGDEVAIGKRYLLHLPKQGVTFSTALAQLPQLEVSMEVPQQDLSIERVRPTDDNPRPSPRILHFEVIDHSPIANTVVMTGPRYHHTTDEEGNVVDGWVDIGPYANGDGNATWRLYSKDSMWGGFLLGGTGSGKTGLLDGLAFSAASNDHTVLWYIDGQGEAGQAVSSSFIPTVADWVGADPKTQADMLSALERVAKARAAENAKAMALDPTVRGFTPSADRPGLMVIVDECHLILNPSNAKRWEELSRIARKVGIALVMATQAAQFDTFGRSETLRAQLLAGNVLVLRVTGANQKGFIPGMNVDPTLLPAIPGYGYTATGRTAPFRSVFCPDYVKLWQTLELNTATLDRRPRGAANLATDGRYSERNSADIMTERLANLDGELDKYDAAAEGDLDADQMQQMTDDTRAKYQPQDGPPANRTPEMHKMAQGLESSIAQSDELTQLLKQFNDQAQANDEAIAARADQTEGAPATLDQTLAALSDTHRAALDHIVDRTRAGEWARTSAINEAAALSRTRGREVVVDLMNWGLVSSQGQGKYGLTQEVEEHLSTA